ILRACSVSTLVNLSLVSSHIRLAALPHLLRTILRFLKYIITNTHKKSTHPDPHSEVVLGPGRYVIDFEILTLACQTTEKVWAGESYYFVPTENEPYPTRIWGPLLTKALTLMPNLRSILIEAQVGEICSESPEFLPTLFGRPRLTDIDLWGIGSEAPNSRDTKKLALLKKEGLGSVLFYSREHLQELDLECDVHLDALANSFPALRTLVFDSDPFVVNEHSRHSKIPFPNLASIKGHFQEIFIFLQRTACSNLRRLDTSNVWAPANGRDIPESVVTEIVTSLRSLHISQGGSLVGPWWKALGPCSPSLNFLAVSFQFESTEELEALRTEIPRLLNAVPLMYVSLVFQGYLGSPGSLRSEEVATEEAIGLSFARNIKTLKYVDVCKEINLLQEPKTWWKIVRLEPDSDNDSKDGVRLEAMDEVEGEILRDRYDQAAL
ncbi:hypothetical protein CPB84DRAFT_1788949, partial [Gymnopilus junonius]